MTGIGDRIRERRKELRISQAKLASELGVTQGFLSKVEQGKSGLSDEVIEKLTRLLNTERSYFWTGVNSTSTKEYIPEYEFQVLENSFGLLDYNGVLREVQRIRQTHGIQSEHSKVGARLELWELKALAGLGKHDEVIKRGESLMPYAESTRNSVLITQVAEVIGTSYTRLNRPDEAIKYLEHAYSLLPKLPDDQIRLKISVIWNFSTAYAMALKFRDATFHLDENEWLIDDQLTYFKRRKAETLVSEGTLSVWLGDCDSAVEKFKQARFLYRRTNDSKGLITVYSAMAYTYQQMHRDEDAAKCYKAATALAKQHGDQPMPEFQSV